MKRIKIIGVLAGAAIAVFGLAAPAQAYENPNMKPCHTLKSRNCTVAAQWDKGVTSYWRGDGPQKHLITQHRARIREQTFFHSNNFTFDGVIDGHPYCWDNGKVMLCGDGERRFL